MAKSINIPLVIAVLVVGVVFISSFSGQTGFATLSCSGNSVLEITPNTVQVGEPIAVQVKGLNNCLGQRVVIRENSDLCNGPLVKSYFCSTPNCENGVVFYKGAAKDYKLTSCVDKDNDGYLIEQGERSTAILKVTALPDLRIKDITYSTTPKSERTFSPIILIENTGITNVEDVTVTFEISKPEIHRTRLIYERTIKNLKVPVGKTQTLTLPQVVLSSDDYVVKATIDPAGLVGELNEVNNVLTKDLIIE